MWQLFVFGSLVLEASEEAIDKIVIVSDMAINSLVATFYRNLIYFLFAAVAGLTGLFGHMVLFISWPIILVGLLSVGSAIFYTYLLKHIELTGSSALDYSRSIVFLLIDVVILKAAFSGSEIIGVLLLIFGGMLFVINPLTRRLKPEYTKLVWLIFVYETISYAAEYYIFKHYTTTINLNEISYIFSTYAIVTVCLLGLSIWKNSWQNFVHTAHHQHYMRKIALSKGLDFGHSLLWYHALRLATVSQVNALEAFYPLILLMILFIAQKNFRLKAGEKLDRASLIQKAVATVVLMLGVWLSA